MTVTVRPTSNNLNKLVIVSSTLQQSAGKASLSKYHPALLALKAGAKKNPFAELDMWGNPATVFHRRPRICNKFGSGAGRAVEDSTTLCIISFVFAINDIADFDAWKPMSSTVERLHEI